MLQIHGHCPLEVVLNTDEIILRNPRTGEGHVAGGGAFSSQQTFFLIYIKKREFCRSCPSLTLETC